MKSWLSFLLLLCRLVDSRDITELQLKQKDCELIIRKKEALPQSAPSAPVVMMHQPPQPMYAPPPPGPSAIPSRPPAAATAAAPAPAVSAPAKASKSSHPPLKCPMAGTFYRCPAPGEPPFVKVLILPCPNFSCSLTYHKVFFFWRNLYCRVVWWMLCLKLTPFFLGYSLLFFCFWLFCLKELIPKASFDIFCAGWR